MKKLLFISITCLILSCKKDKQDQSVPAIQAVFNQDYISSHQGKYFIEIPDVFEAAFIILALKDQVGTSYFVEKRTEYYQSVLKKFNSFKSHKVFSTLNFSYNNLSNYYSFSNNSYCYSFTDKKIVASPIYINLWYPDIFTPNLELVNDFTNISGFENFYMSNEDYYTHQIQLYDSLVKVKTMWNWLEKQFDTRIGSYKIILSPLMDGSHNSVSLKGNDYNECLMFVSAYHQQLKELDTLYIQKLNCFLFTEIDNNYTCPLLDNYKSEISSSMKYNTKWTSDNNFSSSYSSSAYNVINEYFTWSLYSLYAKDNLSSANYLKMVDFIESNTTNRGFKLFKSFNQKVIELYTNKQVSEKVQDLLPKILQWVDQIDKQ